MSEPEGKTDWAKLRLDYARATLDEKEVSPDPLVQLEVWLEEAVAAKVGEPTAMTLATATLDGRPSARIVLCKGVDPRGLTFFTSYESKKGRELAANPRAALVFHWVELERQARLEGSVARVSEEESCAYFQSRPHGSRVGAWASAQSAVVSSRAELEVRFRKAEATYSEEEPPLPPYWGGYLFTPDLVELWQGRPSRMHDRVQYTRTAKPSGESVWTIARLCP